MTKKKTPAETRGRPANDEPDGDDGDDAPDPDQLGLPGVSPELAAEREAYQQEREGAFVAALTDALVAAAAGHDAGTLRARAIAIVDAMR